MKDTSRMEPVTYDVDAAAQYLGVSRRMVYNLILLGRLDACRIGRRTLRIRKADLDEFLNRCVLRGAA